MLSPRAASTMKSAAGSKRRPCPEPREMRATPQNETATPIHPRGARRSRRKITARSVEKTGTEEMMKLAAPAGTTISPAFSPTW